MVATTTRQVHSRSERLSIDDGCCAPLSTATTPLEPDGVDRRSLSALDWFPRHLEQRPIYLEEEHYMAARLRLDADAIAVER